MCFRSVTGAIAVAAVLAAAVDASADLVLNFTPDPSGGVYVNGGGSGVVGLGYSSPAGGWDFRGFLTDFINAPVPGTGFGRHTNDVTGFLRNTSTGQSANLRTFTIARGSANAPYNSPGDNWIEIILDGPVNFNPVDGYAWSILAHFTATDTFDSNGVMFATDLVPGTHVDPGGETNGDRDEVFGSTTLRIGVPEPTALACLALGGLALAVRRRDD